MHDHQKRVVEAIKLKFHHLPVNSSVLGVILHWSAVFKLVDPRTGSVCVCPKGCLLEASKWKVSSDCELDFPG